MLRIYERASERGEGLGAQRADLKRFGEGKESKRYADKAGPATERPAFGKLIGDLAEGDALVVWRIDRLRMTAAELVELLGEVKGKGATFVSLRNGIDSGASPDVLDAVLSVLDSLACADAEVRSERIGAAIAAKEAKGEKWTGGRPKGTPNKLTAEVLEKIREMKEAEESVTEMGRVLGLSRVTIYAGLKMLEGG